MVRVYTDELVPGGKAEPRPGRLVIFTSLGHSIAFEEGMDRERMFIQVRAQVPLVDTQDWLSQEQEAALLAWLTARAAARGWER